MRVLTSLFFVKKFRGCLFYAYVPIRRGCWCTCRLCGDSSLHLQKIIFKVEMIMFRERGRQNLKKRGCESAGRY